jgi:hypothetical protein
MLDVTHIYNIFVINAYILTPSVLEMETFQCMRKHSNRYGQDCSVKSTECFKINFFFTISLYQVHKTDTQLAEKVCLHA